MGSNRFGKKFVFTTWGESHGKAVGVVIDGCPSGVEIDEAMIDRELAKRAPGKSLFTSPRKEPDKVEIVSGLFEGKTTGAPISLVIHNRDVKSKSYESVKHLHRPGHVSYTYLKKYGIYDYRGSGRASARETACRVAAGAIAKTILQQEGIEVVAYIKEIGGIPATEVPKELKKLKQKRDQSPLFCPDLVAAKKMEEEVVKTKEKGDSLGAIVECVTSRLPAGLGDPIYDKMEAKLASAMLSIPATKGFEMGMGFAAARMKGSEHNDPFLLKEGEAHPATNLAGGVLGGITTGEPLIFRVAFKPTSSIKKEQQTVTTDNKKTTFALDSTARHDPCVGIRGVAVVEAMAALVLVDLLQKERDR